MKIGVLTDSSAYLTKEQCEKYNIDVIQIPIIWGDKTYNDLEDIGFNEFYEKLNSAEILPKTSQPSIGNLETYFKKYAEQGYTDLIVVTLSHGISGFYNNVVSAAKNEKSIHIHPFDSKITCAGQADLAMLAGRLVNENASLELIMHDLTDLRSTIGVRFMVNNLSHLKRTGRLSNAASFIGSMLKIKPILAFNDQDQIVAIAKERQYKRAYNHIKSDFSDVVRDTKYPLQLTIFHAADEKKEDFWVKDYSASFPNVKILRSIIGPVVGVHVGQHTMSMIWTRDIDSYFDNNGAPLPKERIDSNK